MKRSILWTLTLAFLVAPAASEGAGEETITGMLVETGCATMAGTEPSDEHVACMVRCAQNGDPIGILTEDGIYRIIGDWASDNGDKIGKLMAKQVEATGTTSDADGIRLIKASTIKLLH